MIYRECTIIDEGKPRALVYNSKLAKQQQRAGSRNDCHNLLHVCRQLRNEFLNDYYSNTRFQIFVKSLVHFGALISRLNAPSPPAVDVAVGCCRPDCAHMDDYLPILTFHVKHPTTVITVVGAKVPSARTANAGVTNSFFYQPDLCELEMWDIIAENMTPAFLNMVRERQIARLMMARSGYCRALVKWEYAPAWMGRNPGPPRERELEFAKKLGFAPEVLGVVPWSVNSGPKLAFGVWFG